jgi:hypothetical protein
MKTAITFLLILYTLTLFPPRATSPADEVPVMITYGTRTGCFGSGPCRIEEVEAETEIPIGLSGAGFGWLSTDKHGRLTLRLDKNSMDRATQQLQFGSGFFHIPKDLIWDAPSRFSHSESIPCRLPKGSYKVKELKQYYILTF